MKFDVFDLEVDPSDSQLTVSTGRLTAAQNDRVKAWGERLREDRPLPGHEPKGPMLRALPGMDDRPPVSLSDIIGAAVADLLAGGVDELAVASYAATYRRAGRGPERGKRADPVLFVLRGTLADRVGELAGLAEYAARALWRDLRAEAVATIPADQPHADADRDSFLLQGLVDRRVSWTVYKDARQHEAPYVVPLGAVARMAIDKWSRRGPDRVAVDGYRFGQATHPRQHRLRHDAKSR